MTDAKKQHYVPQFYLREFVDPNTPPGQEPYVWLFTKNGKSVERRAPKNIFWKTDLYTIDVNGEKLYDIEKELSTIETAYADIVRKKIKARLPLTALEHVTLCRFVATMIQRTIRQKDNQENFYDRLAAQAASLDPNRGSDGSLVEQLQAAKKDAHKVSVLAMLSEIPELLERMNLAFLCTDGTSARFITSDDPVTLFNPDLQWQRFYGPGLAQSGIELTMPVSPEIAICMTWSNLRGYIQIPKWRAEEMNRFTRGHCYEQFVSNSPKKKLRWFSRVPLDSPWFMLSFFRRYIHTRLQQFKSRKQHGPERGE